MSNIAENLAKILNAHYGKDVRQAIHDSISDCYEDGRSGSTDLEARQQINALGAELGDEINALQTAFDNRITTEPLTGQKRIFRAGRLRILFSGNASVSSFTNLVLPEEDYPANVQYAFGTYYSSTSKRYLGNLRIGTDGVITVNAIITYGGAIEEQTTGNYYGNPLIWFVAEEE